MEKKKMSSAKIISSQKNKLQMWHRNFPPWQHTYKVRVKSISECVWSMAQVLTSCVISGDHSGALGFKCVDSKTVNSACKFVRP